MSYPINQRINPYPQTSTGLSSQQLQEIDAVKEGIGNNTVIKGVAGGGEAEKNQWLSPVLTLPVWAGMVAVMNRFNNACNGDFNESIIGKISAWAEKLGEKTPALDKFGQRVVSLKDSFKAKAANKPGLLYSFFNTPTRYKNHMIGMMAGGTETEIRVEAKQQFEKGVKAGEIDLKMFGITPKEFDKMMKDNHNPASDKKFLEMLEKLGKNARFKTKGPKIPFYEKLYGKPKYISDAVPAAKKILCREITWSSFVNKLKAFNNGNKTFLGKKLPGFLLRLIEGLTNGTAGWIWAILMAAFFIADSIKDAINAPKGDKVSTFAESNVNGLGFYMLMPFCISLMHRFGGLKYAGMERTHVEMYRKIVEEFNDKAKAGRFANKAEYKAAKAEIKGLLKGSKSPITFKKIIYAPIKGLSKILTVGLEGFRGYSKIGNIGFHIKRGLGYLVRFPMIMFVISPPFIHLAVRASHLVFGRPAKSVLDDGKESKKAGARDAIQAHSQEANQSKPQKEATQAQSKDATPTDSQKATEASPQKATQAQPQEATPAQPQEATQAQPQETTQAQPQESSQAQEQEPSQAPSAKTETDEDELINKKAA